jgi:hypothetical protein
MPSHPCQSGEKLGRVTLVTRHDVRIYLQGDRRRRVTEALADYMDRNAGQQQDRCVHVPQIVQPDDRHVVAAE